MTDINEESRKLHRDHKGKLAIQSKVPIKNRHDLAVAYTPGVGAIVTDISKDKKLARIYTMKGNSVAVISDGSSILGLGNLGAEAALPVMEGKAILYKEFAGIDAFPICLATQDTEKIIETIKNIAPVFGGINLEDISAPRCFEIEMRLRRELDIPVMHDDQHGTATVVLAGLINAVKLVDKESKQGFKKENARVVVNGAGAAGTAIVMLLLKYGFENIVVCDSRGSIYEGRPDLNDEKVELAKVTNKGGAKDSLNGALKGADIFIGVSKGNLLTTEMVKSMIETSVAKKPIIFALANPVPEIMPDVAKAAGAFIVATGRSDFPNQINNCLTFPGIFRGAIDNGIVQFKDEMFIKAAENLAAHVKNLKPDQILPDVFDKEVVRVVADAIR